MKIVGVAWMAVSLWIGVVIGVSVSGKTIYHADEAGTSLVCQADDQIIVTLASNGQPFAYCGRDK